MSESYLSLPLSAIGERYANLRIIQPLAEKTMERSLRRYGQLTPVVVGQVGGRYEMVDGFKRLRAGRRLSYERMQARRMPGSCRAMKAAIIYLNTKARSIADIESALVIRSLYREEHLTQVEIALLLERHKSFVCRRLKLVEKLGEEVLEHLRLGLINITVCRELSRLPAGNQIKALSTILKYRFTGSETAHLVRLVLQNPRWNHDAILRYPEPILEHRHGDRPRRDWSRSFYHRLAKMDVYLSGLTRGEWNTCRPESVLPVIERMQAKLSEIREHLMQW